ncbi:MBL fold metallo-hydrolase [bacterium]|nr:MBL fold metallo-hydrolase [bacterium]
MTSSHKKPSRSFEPDGALSVTLSTGQIAHRDHIAQSQRLERKFYTISPGVWCLVGNGLSNQTFVEAPDGIIAIDTGESIEEMRAAIKELRAVTTRPIVAVLYTHFHYVGGTRAVFEEDPTAKIPIWGHEKISFNRLRTTSEIAPAYGRGLVEQFAVTLQSMAQTESSMLVLVSFIVTLRMPLIPTVSSHRNIHLILHALFVLRVSTFK